MRMLLPTVGFFFFTASFACGQADDRDHLRVGLLPDGRILVPTNQILKPAGKQTTFPGRPVDLAFLEGGRIAVAKSLVELVFLDAATGEIRQRLATPRRGREQTGFSVVGIVASGNKVYASDSKSEIRVAERQVSGRYAWSATITLEPPAVKGDADPAGMALLDNDHLWVTSTRGNNVQLINLTTGKVEQVVPVGVAPFTIVCPGSNRCFVTNWGGDPPTPADQQAHSSKTPIRVDPRTRIANDGTVSVLEKVDGHWKQVGAIKVGLHPSGLIAGHGGKLLYVANANSDTISVIDAVSLQVVETIACRPEGRLPYGSGCNALALDPTGRTLYVANGTNNCLAVVELGRKSVENPHSAVPQASRLLGLIPTGWYPGAVLIPADGKQLIVANIKGHGSLNQPRPLAQGRRTHDHLGSVSFIPVPDRTQLVQYTKEVAVNNRQAYSLAGLDKPRPGVPAAVVPARHGEPSLFEHVVYIIKENRTYDQMFGDMKEGAGDPNLLLFGEEVTPNHHALARQFTLFDNFYCSGVLSADGHSWVNEAYVTDYLERSFGGWTRSYPDDGSDPLAYPSSGFLWDNALAHKRTMRNYGEFVRQDYAPKGMTWQNGYDDYRNGTRKMQFTIHSNLKSLEPFTHHGYPWFPLLVPDVYRARLFLGELKEFSRKGEFPNLVYVTLPCDHTEGTRPGFPTPRAMVADNDLALGRIVEGLTKSPFWSKMCIFVVEDDPQNGFDHVDAHRTVALALSPYTRRGFVDHTCYNQTGMVKTIELALSLPPMNQLDLSATAMRGCFQDQPVLEPYRCLPARIKLDEMNPELGQLQGPALQWAQKSLALNLDEGDRADEDTLNRILWHTVRGYDRRYPAEFAGNNVEEDPD